MSTHWRQQPHVEVLNTLISCAPSWPPVEGSDPAAIRTAAAAIELKRFLMGVSFLIYTHQLGRFGRTGLAPSFCSGSFPWVSCLSCSQEWPGSRCIKKCSPRQRPTGRRADKMARGLSSVPPLEMNRTIGRIITAQQIHIIQCMPACPETRADLLFLLSFCITAPQPEHPRERAYRDPSHERSTCGCSRSKPRGRWRMADLCHGSGT